MQINGPGVALALAKEVIQYSDLTGRSPPERLALLGHNSYNAITPAKHSDTMSPTIFITGGTGMIGSFLVPRLLRAFPDSRLLLLIRAEDDTSLGLRLERLRSWIKTSGGSPSELARVEAVAGDVCREGLAISGRTHRRIQEEATHIIHGAATIRFDHPLDEARMINVGGTRHILDLAERAAQGGVLKRFLYVGTSSVSGRRGGTIYEHELEQGQEFFNSYEQSKCESEMLVRNCMSRIPATVVRPSIVIGDSGTGRTTSFNVVYIPLRLFQRGILDALVGAPGTLIDLVPVDWVTDVITYLLHTDKALGKTCHLTAGAQRAVSLAEFTTRAAKYFDRHAPLSYSRTFSFVTMDEFRARLRRWGTRAGTLITQLDTLMPYLTVNRLFDSRTTDGLLEGSEIQFPNFTRYADRVFGYCLATNWGKALT
jgi:thioester reductase-like protein